MLEINLNPQLAELLNNHGIRVDIKGDYIYTDLPDHTKFRARTVYEEVNDGINSRLDVMAKTDFGEEIYECCGDFGATIEEAVNNNFRNFSSSSLHPLLAALGCTVPHTYDQITFEEWEINGRIWKVYIGNFVPKFLADSQNKPLPPSAFFDSFERAIKAQQLTNRLHWFRGYYAQINNEIVEREFLMDNELVTNMENPFVDIPVISGVRFYSCRNFIVLKNSASD